MKKNIGFLWRLVAQGIDLYVCILLGFTASTLLFALTNIEEFLVPYLIFTMVLTFGLIFTQESVLGVPISGKVLGFTILDGTGTPRERSFGVRMSLFQSIIPKWMSSFRTTSYLEDAQKKSVISWNSDSFPVRLARVAICAALLYCGFIFLNTLSPYSFANTNLFHEAKSSLVSDTELERPSEIAGVASVDFQPTALSIVNNDGAVLLGFTDQTNKKRYAMIRARLIDGKWKIYEIKDGYVGSMSGFSISKSEKNGK